MHSFLLHVFSSKYDPLLLLSSLVLPSVYFSSHLPVVFFFPTVSSPEAAAGMGLCLCGAELCDLSLSVKTWTGQSRWSFSETPSMKILYEHHINQLFTIFPVPSLRSRLISCLLCLHFKTTCWHFSTLKSIPIVLFGYFTQSQPFQKPAPFLKQCLFCGVIPVSAVPSSFAFFELQLQMLWLTIKPQKWRAENLQDRPDALQDHNLVFLW